MIMIRNQSGITPTALLRYNNDTCIFMSSVFVYTFVHVLQWIS